jgi:hypothetical protein
MSDKMSDMKAKPTVKKTAPRREAQTKPVPTIRNDFTVRDMNRRPQSLLAAAQKLGRVVIRSRSAGNFILTPEVPALNQRIEEAEAFMQRQRAFRARLCRMGFVAPSKEDSEKIARMIAGEEP